MVRDPFLKNHKIGELPFCEVADLVFVSSGFLLVTVSIGYRFYWLLYYSRLKNEMRMVRG